MPRYLFKDWRPDLVDLLNQGASKALNTVPIMGGFGPLQKFVDAGGSALSNPCHGGIATRDRVRKPHTFAGTKSSAGAGAIEHLYVSGLTDVSRAAGYSISGNERWEFEVFGNTVLATNFYDDLQYFDLETSTLFDDVANYPAVRSSYVPRCRYMGVVGQFLVCGNYYDSLNGEVPNGVAWPAIGDPLHWPNPTSDDRAAVQSDRQALEGRGGWVMAVVGGSEVGAVFRESCVHRMDYRGGSEIFEITKVEEEYGCMIPGLAVPFGRQVLFYSEAGWRIFDFMESRPVGKERVDAYFAADLDASNAHRTRALADPDSTRIIVSYPGAGNTNGNPNKLLIYDHALDRFTHGDEAIECLVKYLPQLTGTMDSAATPMDTDPFSMDDVGGAAGDYEIGAWDTNSKIGTFTGAAKDVTLETGQVEMNPGRRARVIAVRPLTTADSRSTLQIATRDILNKKADVFQKKISLTRAGHFPARAAGRYHRLRLDLSGAGFEDALGFEYDAIDAGNR